MTRLFALLFGALLTGSLVHAQAPMSVHALPFRVEQGAIVSVHGDLHNFPGQIHNSDTIYVGGHFINEDPDSCFASVIGGNLIDKGYVVLDNNLYGTAPTVQQITGTELTYFQNLILDGNGNKAQTLDVFVRDTFDLRDEEMDTDDNTLFVLSDFIDIIRRGDGFVSSKPGGWLWRPVTNAGAYMFPIGDSQTTLRYRPAYITPDAASSVDTFRLRFVNNDPDPDGFLNSQTDPTLCAINNLYYHLIDRPTNQTTAVEVTTFFAPADPITAFMTRWNTAPGPPSPRWRDLGNAQNPLISVPGLDNRTIAGITDFSFQPFALAIPKPDAQIVSVIPPSICDTEQPISLVGSPGGPGGEFFLFDPLSGVYTPLPTNELDPTAFSPGQYEVVYIYNLPGLPPPQSCPDTATAPIEILDGPQGTAALDLTINDNDFCEGDSTVLTVTVAPNGPDYDFAWTQSGAAIFGNDSIVTITASGSYNVVITNPVNGCFDTLAAPVNITVYDTPQVVLDVPITSTCDEDTIILTVSSPNFPIPNAELEIEWLRDALQLKQDVSTIAGSDTLNAQITGLYEVILTETVNGCLGMASADLTFVPDPDPQPINVIYGQPEFCLGDSFVVEVPVEPAGFDYDFAWSQSGTPIFGNDSIVTITASGSYNVVITNTVNGCTDTLDVPIEITVQDTPEIIINAQSFITCDEDTIELNAVSPNFSFPDDDLEIFWGYAGNPVKDGILSSANLGTIDTLIATVTGNYTAELQFTYGSGLVCTGRDDADLTFRSDPDLDWQAIAGDTALCEGESVTLEVLIAPPGVSITSILWSNNQSSSTITVDADGDYNVTVVFDNGCSDTLDTPIRVSVYDKPEIILTADPEPTVCADQEIEVCVNMFNGFPLPPASPGGAFPAATLDWFINGNNIGTPSDDPFSCLTTTISGLYEVIYTENEHLCADTATIDLTFNPLPVLTTTLDGNTEFCEGESVVVALDIQPDTQVVTSINWTRDGQPFSSGDTEVTLTEQGLYDVEVTFNTGCSSTLQLPIQVTVFDTIQAALTSELTSICEGESTLLTANLLPPSDGIDINNLLFIWFNDGEEVGNVSSENTFIANQGGTWSVNILTTDPRFCPGRADLGFVMGEILRPEPRIIPSQPGELCTGDTVMLTFLPRGVGYEHFWQFVGSMQTSTADSIFVWETDSIELVLEHDICENFDTILDYEVIVNPKPDGFFTFAPDPAYQNTPVAFTPHLTDSSFIDSTLQYAWYFTGDPMMPDVITQETLTAWSFDAYDADSKAVQVVLQFISNIGETQCTHNDTDTVRILPQFLWVPTAFSPNDDGLNDYWDVYSEVIVPETFSVQIYSRWGLKVAELGADDFNRKDSGWDGLDQESGEPCPEGVYVYVLQGETVPNDRGVPHQFNRTGSITLMR